MKLFDNQQKSKSHYLINCDNKVQIISKTKQSGADSEWVVSSCIGIWSYYFIQYKYVGGKANISSMLNLY